MSLKTLRLKKNEDRRLRAGHVWVYSNEIDTKTSPLQEFIAGEEVLVEASDKTKLGIAYVNPHSLITARLISRKAHERITTELFIQRIQQALALRTRLFEKPYYRLVFGESDGLPGLVADRFDQTLVLQFNTAGMDVRAASIMEAFLAVLPDTQCILLRNDSGIRQQEGLDKYIKVGFGQAPEELVIEENHVSFKAPRLEGQKTGWFYDHRMNRARLGAYVSEKRVLDVFSYLGGWGVQAAVLGAADVICVDSSALAVSMIQKNAALNGVFEKVKTIEDDAFSALKNLADRKEKFDVIILDPPAFIKKIKDKKEGLLAYLRINEAALKLLSPGGILMSCSCSMHLSYEDLVQVIRRAGLHAGCELQMIERGHQGPDHPVHLAIPETDYLKMVVVRYLSMK